MVVSIGWFQIFTWKMVVSPNIHKKTGCLEFQDNMFLASHHYSAHSWLSLERLSNSAGSGITTWALAALVSAGLPCLMSRWSGRDRDGAMYSSFCHVSTDIFPEKIEGISYYQYIAWDVRQNWECLIKWEWMDIFGLNKNHFLLSESGNRNWDSFWHPGAPKPNLPGIAGPRLREALDHLSDAEPWASQQQPPWLFFHGLVC